MALTTNAALDQPLGQWEELDVTFPSAANTDLQIRHHLVPTYPEGVNYIAVRKDRAADVYHDTSGTRKPWGNGYMFLRSSVASARVTLLLYVGHGSKKPNF